MKMIIAIVQDEDSKRVISKLMDAGYRVTKLSTTGGFLRVGNSTLMIGVEKEKLEETLDIIRGKSSVRKEYMVIPTSLPGYVDNSPTPVQVTLGGATVFVVDVEANYRF